MKNIIQKAFTMDKWLLAGFLMLVSFSAEKKINTDKDVSLHPFHMSVFEISHNAKTKSLEVTCKIISEDLESILRTKNGVAIDLAAAKDQDKNEKMIDKYFQENFHLMTDGTPVSLKMIGYEKEKESVYVYFEVAGITSVKKLSVKSAVLYDLSKDQANIVHVIVGGKRQSKKLSYPDQNLEFQF